MICLPSGKHCLLTFHLLESKMISEWLFPEFSSVKVDPLHNVTDLGLALLTLSWDKNWDSHSLMNGYPSFYPRIA